MRLLQVPRHTLTWKTDAATPLDKGNDAQKIVEEVANNTLPLWTHSGQTNY